MPDPALLEAFSGLTAVLLKMNDQQKRQFEVLKLMNTALEHVVAKLDRIDRQLPNPYDVA